MQLFQYIICLQLILLFQVGTLFLLQWILLSDFLIFCARVKRCPLFFFLAQTSFHTSCVISLVCPALALYTHAYTAQPPHQPGGDRSPLGC